jgi:HSP20 family protein
MTQQKQTPVFSREEFLTPFDSLFDNVIQKAFPTFGQEFGIEFFGNNSYPKVDVIDHSDKITIEAEIPGLGKEEVSVDLEENILTISGLKHSHSENTKTRYIRKELKRSSFKRSFKLGDNINSQKIKADFNNGILLVSIPKKEGEQPKKIKIL